MFFTGIKSFINNFLFAFKCSDFETNANFEKFFKSWILPKNKNVLLSKSNARYDEIIDNDRIILKKIINKTNSFKCFDGQIYYLPKSKKLRNINN